MKLKVSSGYILSLFVYIPSILYCSDVTIIGNIDSGNGIGQHSISFADCLHQNNIDISFIAFEQPHIDGIPDSLKSLIKKARIVNVTEKIPLSTLAPISICTLPLSYAHFNNYFSCFSQTRYLQANNLIKLAYSVTEGSKIHPAWTENLNKMFDAVLVPDEFLVNVYKNSGVEIPIFVLPLSITLDDLLDCQVKKIKQKPFVFGCSSVFSKRKNHALLMQAFARAFGNNPDVILKIHGRAGTRNKEFSQLFGTLQKSNVKNITLIYENFSRKEYVDFISSLDCYVLLSKAEGFSISPREALAAGVPCILSNNTAHTTICNTQSVYAVPCTLLEDAQTLGRHDINGHVFNCDVNSAQKALREVYNNYILYKEKAAQGKEWVRQYRSENIKHKYLNIVKPKKVIFGDENKITDDYLMTNAPKLFAKYQRLIGERF